MCKILVKNFIIKDILKKKNDVHWISVRTIEQFTYISFTCARQIKIARPLDLYYIARPLGLHYIARPLSLHYNHYMSLARP